MDYFGGGDGEDGGGGGSFVLVDIIFTRSSSVVMKVKQSSTGTSSRGAWRGPRVMWPLPKR